ncbi:MAG: ribonuclease P protein component [Schleiferiaceae bacterium]|nr:ribonuclease P protein component [Schleiferiaceae bacterium]
MRFTFSKDEKLTSPRLFDAIHKKGMTLKSFPFSVRFIDAPLDRSVQRQIAVVVPKRSIKSAVHRNRIKRQMRELYRLNKHLIKGPAQQQAWSLRYLGNRLNEYSFLEDGFLKLIHSYNAYYEEFSSEKLG